MSGLVGQEVAESDFVAGSDHNVRLPSDHEALLKLADVPSRPALSKGRLQFEVAVVRKAYVHESALVIPSGLLDPIDFLS